MKHFTSYFLFSSLALLFSMVTAGCSYYGKHPIRIGSNVKEVYEKMLQMQIAEAQQWNTCSLTGESEKYCLSHPFTPDEAEKLVEKASRHMKNGRKGSTFKSKTLCKVYRVRAVPEFNPNVGEIVVSYFLRSHCQLCSYPCNGNSMKYQWSEDGNIVGRAGTC